MDKREKEALVRAPFSEEIFIKAHNYAAVSNSWDVARRIVLVDGCLSGMLTLTTQEKLAEKLWPFSEGNMLELGSHWGRFCYHKMYNTKLNICGCDASTIMPEHCSEIAFKLGFSHRVKFKTMLAENLEFDDDFFDVVYAFETLEHVSLLDKSLSEIYRVLKTTAALILSVPLENHHDGGMHLQKHSKEFWLYKFNEFFSKVEFVDFDENRQILCCCTK